MRSKLSLALAALGAAALIAGTSLPATAADTGDTTVTFALSGSTLSIAVQASASITGGAAGATTTVSGRLGNVTVTDLRGGTANWSAMGSSTAFTTGTLPNSNPTSSSVTYNTGAITPSGSIVIANSGDHTLTTTPTKVAGPSATVGNNTAQWNPTLTITMPSDALAGNYTGTITTSVS